MNTTTMYADSNEVIEAFLVLMIYLIPLGILPTLATNLGRLRTYLRTQSVPSKLVVERTQSAEVQRKVQEFLKARQHNVVCTMTDWTTFQTLIFEIFLWAKAISFGVSSIPRFDVAISPWALLWLIHCAPFQSRLFQGEWVNSAVAIGYNLLLVCFAALIKLHGVTDRETMMTVCRLFGGFFFCDYRKASSFQIIFILLKLEWQPHIPDGNSEVWDVFFWHMFQQIVIVGPMCGVWFAVEYFVRTLAELMVQKSDTEASFQAARAVLSSQCDAEAFLREDLTFKNPSAKMAHFFGMRVEDLQDMCFLDILSTADKERFQTFVTTSAKRLQEENRTSAAMSLTMSINHSSGRQIETRVYLGSIAPLMESEGICHLIALNEVRETGQEAEVTPDAVPSAAASSSLPDRSEIEEQDVDNPEMKREDSSSAGSLPLNADTLAFHAWSYGSAGASMQAPMGSINSVSVLFDANSLEVLEISMSLNCAGARQRKKTQLRECIIPGVWDEFRHWLESAKSRKPSSPPPIVPFVFPKIVSAVVAARCSELKQAPSGEEQLLLTLRDIRLRRYQSGRSTMGKPMGRGTASHVSRESLTDMISEVPER